MGYYRNGSLDHRGHILIKNKHRVNHGLEIDGDGEHKRELTCLLHWDNEDRHGDGRKRREACAFVIVNLYTNKVLIFDIFCITARLELAKKVLFFRRKGYHHIVLLLGLRYHVSYRAQIHR